MPYIEQVRLIQEKKVQQLEKRARVTESEEEADEEEEEEQYGNPVVSLFSNFFRDLVDVLTGKENMSGEEERVQSVQMSDNSITDEALQNEESSLAPVMLEEEANSEVSVKVSK